MKKIENSFENLRLNDEIKFHTKKVRLVGDNVEVGIYDTYKALQIADELEESVKDIQPIYDIVKKHDPEYDVDAITTEVLEARENEKA